MTWFSLSFFFLFLASVSVLIIKSLEKRHARARDIRVKDLHIFIPFQNADVARAHEIERRLKSENIPCKLYNPDDMWKDGSLEMLDALIRAGCVIAIVNKVGEKDKIWKIPKSNCLIFDQRNKLKLPGKFVKAEVESAIAIEAPTFLIETVRELEKNIEEIKELAKCEPEIMKLPIYVDIVLKKLSKVFDKVSNDFDILSSELNLKYRALQGDEAAYHFRTMLFIIILIVSIILCVLFLMVGGVTLFFWK